jgi:hypothetical protein
MGKQSFPVLNAPDLASGAFKTKSTRKIQILNILGEE